MKVDDEFLWLSEDHIVDDSEYWVDDGGEDMRGACLSFKDSIKFYKKMKLFVM